MIGYDWELTHVKAFTRWRKFIDNAHNASTADYKNYYCYAAALAQRDYVCALALLEKQK